MNIKNVCNLIFIGCEVDYLYILILGYMFVTKRKSFEVCKKFYWKYWNLFIKKVFIFFYVLEVFYLSGKLFIENMKYEKRK